MAATILGTIEMASRKGSERAQIMASRISVDAYGRETARQILADARASMAGTVRTAGVEAAHRRDQAAGQPLEAVAVVVADADAAAAAQLAAVAASTGKVPGPASGVDTATRDAIGSTQDVLDGLEGQMIHQLALARRSSRRRSSAVFALSLVALAGVLAGLAAVLGAGRDGRACLVLSTAALLGALGWGVTAVLAFGTAGDGIVTDEALSQAPLSRSRSSPATPGPSHKPRRIGRASACGRSRRRRRC